MSRLVTKLPPVQPLKPAPQENVVLLLYVAGPENNLQAFVGIRRHGAYILPHGDPIPADIPAVEGWRYLTDDEVEAHREGIEAASQKFLAMHRSLESVSLLPHTVEAAPVDSSEV